MKISVVIPVFNEGNAISHNLSEILHTLEKIQNYEFQIIVVNDGSVDHTAESVLLLCKKYSALELISFNRNFGKEAAMHAGLTYASGNAVIVMDSDLQHPPEIVTDMIRIWDSGVMVVDACKISRGKESILSKTLSNSFYYIFARLTKIDIKNNSDFKLLDREVVDAYCDLPERKRFFRGMIPFLGFTTEKVLFDVPVRKMGTSSWSHFNLFKFALTALSSFTSAPLHMVSITSIIFFISSIIIGGLALYDKISGNAVTGFTTVILLILITGSLIMFSLGQIGVYIEQMFDEIKQRPYYIINDEKSYYKKKKL